MKYKSNARENQDLFVLSVLNKKKNGTYVEIGSAYPIESNNTYLLENEFDWTGISIDSNIEYVNLFNYTRKNKCICADATTLDYTKLFESNNLPTHIDFLQLDIDPPHNTFKALQQINFEKYSFSIITYEHDLYAGGVTERTESRKIFQKLGYTRILSDVMHGDIVFEDWYINEKYMPNDFWKNFKGEFVKMDSQHISKNYYNLFESILL